jgi:hypothetical protein
MDCDGKGVVCMTASTQYVFKGVGQIDADWVGLCLHLFRQKQINIRRLVLLKGLQKQAQPQANSSCFSCMELQFTLPGNQPQTSEFQSELKTLLARQHWFQQEYKATEFSN